MGRLIGTTTTYSFLPNTPFTNSYSYDADSNRTGYTAPDGSTNTYSYDTLNRLTTLANSWAGSFGFAYDSLSRRTQMTRPNGITTNYTYDSLSRLLSVLHQAGGSTIDGAVYTLDAAGNRSTKQDDLAGVTTTYGYDPIYELLSATQGGTTTESYSYDPVGNRTASLGIASYTTNSSNEMTANSNASYTYDNNGNTHTKTDSSGTTTYAWDYENRLKQITLPGAGGTVSFLYDPFRRRIQKAFTQNGTTTTTNYLYDGNNVIETVNQIGSVLAKFVQGQEIDEPLAESSASGVDFYEQDGLDSITSLTSTTGAVAQTYTYDAFGNITNSSGTVANPFRYVGRDFDSETNLYYYRTRYFDPANGRFLNEDPIGFLGSGTNSYAYVGNDPVIFTDPLGLCKPTNCTPNKASAVQYAEAAAESAALTGQFFSGLGPANRTFGPDSAMSQVMAQSAGVQDVLNSYTMLGQTQGLYTFGLTGAIEAGGNPAAQFVGSFRYSIVPTNGGINLTLTNTTSLRSLTYDRGPQYQRSRRFPTPMGNIHQIIDIFVPCK